MKFMEEQYQEIIKVWGSEAGYVKGIQAVVDYLSSIDMSFMVGEAVALANPRTREWAHEQHVEKEKRYVWGTQTINGVRYVLVKKDGVYSMKDRWLHYCEAVPLTETEVKSLKFLDFSELYPEEVE